MDLYDDFLPVAVEGAAAVDAEAHAPAAARAEPDPDWQPF